MIEQNKSTIQTKNAFFFSHDSNARNDEKIIRLRMKHGAEGYGIYFMLIEMLLEASDYVLQVDYEALAFNLRVDSEKIKSVIENFDLFDIADDLQSFHSPSFTRRMQPLELIREHRRQAGIKSAESKKKKKEAKKMEEEQISTPVEQNTNTCCQNFNIREESKIENNRANKSRADKKPFAEPTPQEVERYCKERKNSIDALRFISFYQSKGWMVGRNKMSDWKAAIRTWEHDDKPLPRRDRAPNIVKHENNKEYEQF